jgi:type II secretory pathway component PulC
MSGFTRIRGLSALILGLALIQIPPQLQAQTSAERVRVEEIRRALERAEAQQQTQLVRIEEALVQAREQAAQNEYQTQEALAARREMLERAQEQMEKYQQVQVRVRSRIRLGVTLASNQDEEMDRQGVLLSGVMDDSPAQDAGLQEGDILTHLNGNSLINPIPGENEEEFDSHQSLPVQRLLALVQELDEGDEVDLRYLRDGSRHEVSFLAAELDEPNVMVWSDDEGPRRFRGVYRVGPDKEIVELKLSELKNLDELENLTIELSDMEGMEHLKDLKVKMGDMFSKDMFFDSENFRVHTSPDNAFRIYSTERGDAPSSVQFYRQGDFPSTFEFFGQSGSFGLEVTKLNPELGEYFSASEGLLVLSVDEEENSLNLAAGDVVLAIDGRDVEDQGDIWRILGSYEDGETVTFTVVRKGQRQEVEGSIG